MRRYVALLFYALGRKLFVLLPNGLRIRMLRDRKSVV